METLKSIAMKTRALKSYTDLAVLLIRLAFGFRLIYGTIDNILSYDRMLEFSDFLTSHGFPFPIVSAFISVIFQFAAGISWVIGYKVRWMSGFMIINFIIAILGVHIGDTYLNTAPAIHLLVVSIFLLIHGPGKYAVEREV